MTPYATRLREHLAESKRTGVPFEGAWKAAVRDVPRPPNDPGWGDVMTEVKRYFRDAYLNIGPPLGHVGAIAERDRLSVDRYHQAPERTSRRCGWGGTYCRKQGEPWLCPEHAAVLDAIPARCASHMCRRNAEANGYCAKHADKAEANTRGAAARHERQAA